MINKFLFLTLLFLSNTTFTSNLTENDKFIVTEEQVTLTEEIIQKLESNHLVKKGYENIKGEAFEVFIERLDPNKNIYINQEVESILSDVKKESSLRKDLQTAYYLFNKYVDRYQDRYEIQVEFLNEMSDTDLQSNRKIKRSLSEASRQTSIFGLKSLWKDLSTNDVIQLMLAGNSLEESVDKTIKRMDNQLNYFEQTREEDVFGIFVNSIAAIYGCLLYTSPSPRDQRGSRMPSSA